MPTFVPFGIDCDPAMMLDHSGLRTRSMPFDWVGAYPEYIKHSLDTDFKEWFDQSNLSYKKASDGRDFTTCKPYFPYIHAAINPEAGFFNHHNLTDPEIQEKFKNRIERFKQLISSDEHIIFLTTNAVEPLREHGLLDYFKRDARTDFVFLVWEQSGRNVVEKSIKDGFTVITYFSKNKMYNYPVMSAIGDALKSLD